MEKKKAVAAPAANAAAVADPSTLTTTTTLEQQGGPAPAFSCASPPQPHGVPRLVHQTWKHRHLRHPLSTCASSFTKWNPHWDYRLWTDEECEDLIRRELPDFLPTYLAYPKGIYRADIFRVAVLYIQGGVYADLDVECLRPLDELIEAAGPGEWEVLLARDHPLHEELHWGGRAMWMNAFMVAKPRARFFGLALERLTRAISRPRPKKDVVNETGPGFFSTVIESSLCGVLGLGIRPLPWNWIHPLPNIYVPVREQKAYMRLIRKRTWRDGAQVDLNLDEGPLEPVEPFVAHYWWHSYIEGSREVNMLIRYAPLLLQTDGEIAERRLQKWVPRLGDALDAAGQALAEAAETRSKAVRLLGEPAVGVETAAIPFMELAHEVLAGLDAEAGSDPLAANAASNAGGGTLYVVDVSHGLPSGADRFMETALSPAEGLSQVLLLGGDGAAVLTLSPALQQAGFALVTESGGWLWQRHQSPVPPIPRIIHLFQPAQGEWWERELCEASWLRHESNGWKVKYWTVRGLAAAVEKLHPEFLDTFLRYADDDMRWGAARYFILASEGGVAVSPGVFCLRPVEKLLKQSRLVLPGKGVHVEGRKRTMYLGDAVIASEPGHPFWNNIAQDLDHHARNGASRAVGSHFITSRARESHRFIASKDWPSVVPLEAVYPTLPSEVELPAARRNIEKWLRKLLPGCTAIPLAKALPSLKDRLNETLAAHRSRRAARIHPLFLAQAQELGWTKFLPPVTDEQVAEFEACCDAETRAELDSYFAVEAVLNPKPSAHVVSTCLFWKNANVGGTPFPTPTKELLQTMVPGNVKGRRAPWYHYVEPLLKGAAMLAAEQPEISVRVYLAEDLGFLAPELTEHCEVRLMRHSSLCHNPGAMWRLLALEDAPDMVTCVDADSLDKTWQFPWRNKEKLDESGLATWRCPSSREVDRASFIYRPMMAGVFGSRVRLPVALLAKAFIWHLRRGSLPRRVLHSRLGDVPQFGSRWPSYGGDELFLATTLYPRLVPHGMYSVTDEKSASQVQAMDLALCATWLRPVEPSPPP